MTLKSMIAALAGYVGARFLGAGLGLLTQLALARALLPADVTVVFMAMSAAAFLSLIMNGGEAQLASTHLPPMINKGWSGRLAAFHGIVLRNMVFVFAVLALALLVVWWLSLLSHELTLALFAGLIAAPFSALARYNAMVANSLRWFPLSYVPDFIVRPGLFLIAIIVFILTGLSHNVLMVLAAFVVFVWVTGLGQAALMQGQGLKLSHWRSWSSRYARVIRPRSLALLVVSIVAFAFADVVMLLAGLLLAPEDAAVAGVAVRLAAIAGFVLQAAQLFVLPDFSDAMLRRDAAKSNALLWRMNGVTIVVTLAAMVGALVLGRFVLSFFGAPYVAGANLLVLFLVGQAVRALGGMNQNLLAIEGHQIRTATSCLLALAVLIISSVLIVPRLGLIGLGYCVIAAELTWMVGLAILAQQRCGRRADLLWLARST